MAFVLGKEKARGFLSLPNTSEADIIVLRDSGRKTLAAP